MTDIIESENNLNITTDSSSNEYEYSETKNVYPFICKECYNFSKIEDFDFKKNKFNIVCINGHKHSFNSYQDLIKELSSLNNLLCHDCKNVISDKKRFKCNDCNLFYCESCKTKHNEEKTDHSNFTALIEGIKETESDNLSNNTNDDENQQIKDNFNKINDIKKVFIDWKKEIINKIDSFLNTLSHYCEINEIIKKYKAYENNEYLDLNHKLFQNNIYEVNNYLKNNLNTFEQKKDNFEEKSLALMKMLIDFEETDIFYLKNEKKKVYDKIVSKISEMKNRNLELKLEAVSFCPFNKGEYMIFGMRNGELLTCKQNNDKSILKTLEIKVFEKEIKLICELDEDLIAVSDGITSIKIIQYKQNCTKYTIIQTIPLKEDSGLVYSMISLPILSSSKKNHFLCTADDNHILIFKSNKELKSLNPEKNSNNDISFSLIKDIKLNTKTHCLIEANDKYIVAGCTDINTVKFFDVRNDFKEVEEIKNISLNKGSNIFSLIPNKNLLITANTDGFMILNLKKRNIYKRVHCKYSVSSLDMLSDNTFVCCTSQDKKTKIKQYQINIDDSYSFSKISETSIHYNIWKLKRVNQRIFFIDHKNIINYLI